MSQQTAEALVFFGAYMVAVIGLWVHIISSWWSSHKTSKLREKNGGQE